MVKVIEIQTVPAGAGGFVAGNVGSTNWFAVFNI
jgi:hypothetical protein